MNIHPFKIAIPQSTLNDLRERLARTRWPDEIEGAGWSYGTKLDSLKSLVAYWQHEYNWRKQEAILNRYTQFRTDLDGLSVHCIFVVFFRGILALPQGKFEEAAAAFREMQRLVPQGDVELHALLHYGLAQLAASQGHLQHARQLGEAGALILERIGHYQFYEIRRWLKTLPPNEETEIVRNPA